ncbi:MAG: SAM-dependent methyltransferase, partial [Planctomycetota bacterium]
GREEWDGFEGRILENRERWCAAHPDDEDARAALERSRSWNDAQQRWGRDTMGFALYLFKKS